MSRFARSAVVAFALANLYLLFLTGPLISPQHQLAFHLPGSATALFGAVLLDLFALSLVLIALLFWASRHPLAELLLWAALLLPLPWVLIETIAGFEGTPANRVLLWLAALFGAGAWLWAALHRRALGPAFVRWQPILVSLLGFVALSGAVILSELLWFGWQARHLNAPVALRAAVPAPPGSPRVVWILLDELSFRQVYGHRAPGLALPNFDRLAAESTVFSHAVPTAQYTRVALPGLLTGQDLSATAPTADGHLLQLHKRGQRGWHSLQPRNTVFGDAADAGMPTGIAGWYEPYCRLLPAVLNRCFWTYSDNIAGGLSGDASVVSNALQPLRGPLAALLHRVGLGPAAPSADAKDVQQHAADYRALLSAGDSLLAAQTAGLQLVHMPIPHPWGIYDRRTGTFPAHRTSYLDNLALADAYLGHLRALLAQGGAWDSTDIIVMGDHGWRAESVWRRSGFWAGEEDAAAQGAAPEDPPALIVKLHGQTTPARIDARFDDVHTRALIDALLTRRLRTPEDLRQWTQALP